jgi:hypothetical protein
MRIEWLLMCASALLAVGASTGCADELPTQEQDTGGPSVGPGNGHGADASTHADAASAADAGSSGDDDATVGDDDASVAEDAAQPHDAGKSHEGGAAADSGTSALVWHRASKTNFTSYPDPGSDECIKYNGCAYEGQFAALNGTQPLSWVKAHNIAAVHSKDFNKYKLHNLRLRSGSKTIDVVVYDECADSDCSGCCTQNAKPSGYLIDLESFTDARFGVPDGQIDWACLDPGCQ